ncbi:uncharacterized protein N7515_009333 [Penicillium bovifimosum]|uniref:Uncharacterized protein n=1 Tax=Penicillium bovifimosum TaxID=126998 RepID=A0A9W9KVE0_9EURO|nr:uncharacterized protein N7515_009333 [Penicillium bovifimosum]KAJ5121372.1 hypothetical protein N7515_009333 [Penicillium bovifimosum]
MQSSLPSAIRDGVPKVQGAEKRCTNLNKPADAPTPAMMPATPVRAPLGRKAKATHAVAKELSPAPSNDSDALSSAPPDVEKK